MKVRTIKVNYILNIIRTILSTLTGIFTLPYITRVLGVDSVGKFEYINSIISYFILFSALGIPMYGIREIARVRDDLYKRTKVVAELGSILLATTLLSYVILFGVILHLNFLSDYKLLILVLAPSIFLSTLGFEWFFQGIEDQMYITIRFIIIKIITLIMLFTLVKNADDYILYAGIMVFSSVGANIFNFIYIRKYINLRLLKFKDLQIKKHLYSVLIIFSATISVSIYLLLDNTLLGLLGKDKNVGIYSTANKLIRFAILFVTTLGSIMLPRLSYLYDNDKRDDYKIYLSKSLKYILFFSIPICVFIFTLARPIIIVMAGENFLDAIIPMKILSPLLPIIGIAYYLAFMILYPQGREKIYTIIVVISAVVSVLLNIIFIPKYFELATSFVSLTVELVGVLLMIMILRKQLKEFGFFDKKNVHYFIGGLLIYMTSTITSLFVFNNIHNLIISGVLGLSFYLLYLKILKDIVVLDLVSKIRDVIFPKK